MKSEINLNNIDLTKDDWKTVKDTSEAAIRDARKIAEIHLAILKLANDKIKSFE